MFVAIDYREKELHAKCLAVIQHSGLDKMITITCECGETIEMSQCYIDNFGNIDITTPKCDNCCELAISLFITTLYALKLSFSK